MAAAPSTPWTDWRRAGDVLAEISASHDEAARFWGELFQQLERLSGELVERQRAWQAEQQRTEREIRERTAELERQHAAMAAQRERIREEVVAEVTQAAIASAAADEHLRRMREEVEQERAKSQSALQSAEAQLAQLTRATAELGEARKQVEREREQFDVAPTEPQGAVVRERLLEQLRQAEEQRAVLERERAVLETELETVRGRAAELAETLAQQKRQMAEERTVWMDEIKRMRHLLETISQRQAEHHAAEEPPAVHRGSESRGGRNLGSGNETAGDPVLSSVMAQFEMLQKDLARRRRVAVAQS